MDKSTPEQGPLRVLLITDVFPPGSGGSGWSTYYLGCALGQRGHRVSVLRPVYPQADGYAVSRQTDYGGLPVEEVAVPTPPGWTRKIGIGRAFRERAARIALTRRAVQLVTEEGVQILHGQHAISGTAAVAAAGRTASFAGGPASVVTVRDYWPLCPSSTRLFTGPGGTMIECRDCHLPASYMRCAFWREQGTGAAPAAMASARWMLTRLRSVQLARSNAVVAVSNFVKGELVRSRRVVESRVATIPNLVDLDHVDRAIQGIQAAGGLHEIAPDEPFALFVGKLDHNKGAHLLPAIVERAHAGLPVVVAGDGPLRGEIESRARLLGLDFRFYDWLDNDMVQALMSRADALLFPSAWQEPLSRVLLEGCAAGAAIVAMNTGGTPDIITDGESGLLAGSAPEMADALARLLGDRDLAARLRAGARRTAEERFSSDKVAARVESLYHAALAGARAG